MPTMTVKHIKAGSLKRIHVNRQILARNIKLGRNDPAYTIQTSSGSIPARYVEIVTGALTFDQSKPQLSCGARLYGETRAKVYYQ